MDKTLFDELRRHAGESITGESVGDRRRRLRRESHYMTQPEAAKDFRISLRTLQRFCELESLLPGTVDESWNAKDESLAIWRSTKTDMSQARQWLFMRCVQACWFRMHCPGWLEVSRLVDKWNELDDRRTIEPPRGAEHVGQVSEQVSELRRLRIQEQQLRVEPTRTRIEEPVLQPDAELLELAAMFESMSQQCASARAANG